MKVMTVGVGKLGSQVAWHVLREFKPEKMLLVDIKNLDGDLLDLQHACEGMNIKTEILIKNDKRPYDIIIITAGLGRNKEITTHEELWGLNKPIIGRIVADIKSNGNLSPETVLIVMTNPVEKMTKFVQDCLPGNLVMNPEADLMHMRSGKELGWKIVSSKGYTNFGPAVSVVKLIERLI